MITTKMNLILDVNPPKFSQDLLAIIYEPRRLLSNIIQELVIENIKDRFFVISCGFEYIFYWCRQEVNHGDERIYVSVSPGPGTSCLEQTV